MILIREYPRLETRKQTPTKFTLICNSPAESDSGGAQDLPGHARGMQPIIRIDDKTMQASCFALKLVTQGKQLDGMLCELFSAMLENNLSRGSVDIITPGREKINGSVVEFLAAFRPEQKIAAQSADRRIRVYSFWVEDMMPFAHKDEEYLKMHLAINRQDRVESGLLKYAERACNATKQEIRQAALPEGFAIQRAELRHAPEIARIIGKPCFGNAVILDYSKTIETKLVDGGRVWLVALNKAGKVAGASERRCFWRHVEGIGDFRMAEVHAAALDSKYAGKGMRSALLAKHVVEAHMMDGANLVYTLAGLKAAYSAIMLGGIPSAGQISCKYDILNDVNNYAPGIRHRTSLIGKPPTDEEGPFGEFATHISVFFAKGLALSGIHNV